MEIAKIILAQLGGNKFLTMTGAYCLTSDKNKFMFRLRTRSPYPNYVSITLNSMDTYDVKFCRIHGMNFKELSSYTDIYCDMLRQLFEKETGLRTSL